MCIQRHLFMRLLRLDVVAPRQIKAHWSAITAFDGKATPATSNQETMARIMEEIVKNPPKAKL